MDHIPESILHHILSYLDSPKQLVRMSVVSKHWFAVTASFPVLDFDISKFYSAIPITAFQNILDMFLKYVDRTALRFHEQNFTSAHTLKLRTWIMKPTQVNLINQCLGLILMKGVKVLVIDISDDEPLYRVPNIVLSASSLTSLDLHKCELPSSIMVDGVKFKSLRQLDLHRVPLNEEVIKHLTASCPLLEKLVVEHCPGFKIFMIYGQNLQEVKFFYDHVVEKISIEAPNLCNLGVADLEIRGAPSMDLATCINLKMLNLGWLTFPTSYGFADLLSSFPLLETLFLSLPGHCNSLRLSSPSLKILRLYTGCDLENIDLYTPNLELCDYNCFVYDVIFETDSHSSRAHLQCLFKIDAGNLWVQTLRQFLDKKHRFKVLKLSLRSKYPNDVEELELIQCQPLELDHVELELHSLLQLSDYVTIAHAVLWYCHPRSLELSSDFDYLDIEERSHAIELIYKKLLQQEDEAKTEIQIVLSSSLKDEEEHFGDLNSLLAALPRDQLISVTITFTKEEVVQEATKSEDEDKGTKSAQYE
ncbi:F-box domain containing protein [Tanacetum coccineum]